MRKQIEALGRAVFVVAVLGSLAVGAREVFAFGGSKASCENCQNDPECEVCCQAVGSICPLPNSGGSCLCA